jgi:type I restriction enzyme S subunit
VIQVTADNYYPLNLEQLPHEWAVAYVGDIVSDIQPGFASGVHNQEGFGVPHLRPMNIDRTGRINLDLVKYVPANDGVRLQKGDVLFNNTNSPELIGKTAYIDRDAGWAFSNHMTRLKPVNEVDSRFIAWQLHFLWMTGYFLHICTNHVNQASIASKTLATAVPLVVAPLPEQHRIVAAIEMHFTRLDAAVAALQRASANLKRYRTAVLKAAVDGRLVSTEAELSRRGAREFEPGGALLRRILEDSSGAGTGTKAGMRAVQGALWDLTNGGGAPAMESDPVEFGPLPEGWTWARVKQIGQVKLGRQRAPQHHTGPHMRPYLRVANVFEDRIDLTNVLEMNFSPAEYETYRLEPGDILLNEGQSLELVGRPAMFRGELEGACFQNTLVRFRSSPHLSAAYALIVFLSYLHSGRFQRIAKWTTNIAHLGAERFASMEFPLPPLAEQHRIVDEVDRRLSVLGELQVTSDHALTRAKRMRQSILKRAFEGKLVPQDPSDEPAENLLERVRLAKAEAPVAKRPARGMRMKKQPEQRSSLVEVLGRSPGGMTPEDLFEQSGHSDDSVDRFYAELKREIDDGRVLEERSGTATVLLRRANL